MGQGRRETIPCGCEGHRTLTIGGVQCIPPKQVHIFRPVQLPFLHTPPKHSAASAETWVLPRFPPFFSQLSQPQAGHSQHYKCHDYNTGKKPQRTCYYGTEQVGTPFSPPPLYKNISLKQQHAPSPFCNLNARNFNSLQPSEGKLTQGLLRPYPMSREGKGNGRSSCMKHGCARQHMQNWAMAHPRPWCQAQCRPFCSVNTEWFHGPSCRSCSSVRLDLTATAQPTLHQISSWKPIIFLPHSKWTHLFFFFLPRKTRTLCTFWFLTRSAVTES